jgi:nicotinamide-nucleotide amidase
VRSTPMSQASTTRASTVIAVGDELLAGFTLDTNSHWLAQRLRTLGIPLKRVTLVRDRVPEIAEQVLRDLGDPAVADVFCCGGLGPTLDDRTAEAVAHALGRQLVVWAPVLERIERRVRLLMEAELLSSTEEAEASRRMARVPAGPDHVFANRRGMAPGLLYRSGSHRLYVLPGVPRELKTIFVEEVEPRFLGGRRAAFTRELRFPFAIEARFAPMLDELESAYPDVSVGSYPGVETKELLLRFSGEDPTRVLEAMDVLRRRAARLGLEPLADLI